MSSMIIVSQNMADIATITSTNSPANLGPENLKKDLRGLWCRLVGPSNTITLKWNNPVPIGAVVIVGSSLKPSSKFRVKVFEDVDGLVLKHDSNWIWAAPGTTFDNEDWTEELNTNESPADGNEFAYSIPPSSAHYLKEQLMGRSVTIELLDNDSSFIDISRLVVGPYFSPKVNANYGQSNSIIDLTTHSRSASGGLRSEVGPISRVLNFSLDYVNEEDRGRVQKLVEKSSGSSLWVSLCPDSVDKELERDKSIYGRLSSPISLQWQTLFIHTADFQIEGI